MPLPDPTPESTPPLSAVPQISEIRYPLPDMLREIELDRKESALGRDTLDQVEIKKLFANRRQHHGRGKK